MPRVPNIGLRDRTEGGIQAGRWLFKHDAKKKKGVNTLSLGGGGLEKGHTERRSSRNQRSEILFGMFRERSKRDLRLPK